MKIFNIIAVILMLFVGIATYEWGVHVQFIPSIFAKAEAAQVEKIETQSQKRFLVLHTEEITISIGSGWSKSTIRESLSVICDTYTGNLIYSNGYRGGIWGTQSGCQKNPR